MPGAADSRRKKESSLPPLGPADSSPASRTDGGCGVGDRRNAAGLMRRSQHHDYSASASEHKDSEQLHHNHNHHRYHRHHHSRHLRQLPTTSDTTKQCIGPRMSLETLLQAAYYVEQEEKKRERLASTSTSASDQHSFPSASPHSNHTYTSTEPRGEYHALLLSATFHDALL